MGDQLDFSKLLLWKLLLSISSLDDALDANYYADWDVTFGDKRRGDSYLNTLIIMKDDENDLFLKDHKRKQKLADKVLLDEDKNKKINLEQNRKQLFLQDHKGRYYRNRNIHGGQNTAEEKKQDRTYIQIKREELKQKQDKLQELNSKSTAPSIDKTALITAINQLETEIKDKTPMDTDKGRREENAKISKLRRLKRQKARDEHKTEMSRLDEEHKIKMSKFDGHQNKAEMDAAHKKYKEDMTTEHNKYIKDKSYAPSDEHDAMDAAHKKNKEELTAKHNNENEKFYEPSVLPDKKSVMSNMMDKTKATSGDLAKKQATAKVATEAAINKHVSHEALAAAKAHGEVLTHHAKDLHAKGKAHLAKAAHHAKAAHKAARNSNHGSGADFKKKQNESNNLIYLEKAIDDEANEPSASTVTFEGHEYKKYGHQEEFISSLEDRLNLLNSPLVGIVNEFYDTIDPLTLTYLNKLIATSIPLIDRIKLYIFLASLIPEFGEAFAMFLETINPMWLNIYTTKLNHNMQGLFYKHGDVLQTKRAASLLKSKKRTKMLKDGIKKSAFGIDSVTQTPTK